MDPRIQAREAFWSRARQLRRSQWTPQWIPRFPSRAGLWNRPGLRDSFLAPFRPPVRWNCLLAGLTFFVDHFRFPALAALAIALVVIASLGTSDHVFSIVERTKAPAKLLRPEEAFRQ